MRLTRSARNGLSRYATGGLPLISLPLSLETELCSRKKLYLHKFLDKPFPFICFCSVNELLSISSLTYSQLYGELIVSKWFLRQLSMFEVTVAFLIFCQMKVSAFFAVINAQGHMIFILQIYCFAFSEPNSIGFFNTVHFSDMALIFFTNQNAD